MESNETEEGKNRLFLDAPITKIEQDRLGRVEYAEHLAKIILNHSFTESAVIGICGEWGTGKTSLMNLVENNLEERSGPDLHIVHFKPWRWSDERWLNARFFDAIVKQAGIKDKNVKKNIATFVDMLDMMCELDERLLIVKPIMKRVSSWLRSSGDSIEQVKKKLNEKMLSLQTKIVVVLDDIDRLTPQEALEVMKLVKCNADFSNILYIMLYQRDILTKYLAEAGFREQAEFYLEKIEQVHFSVPQAGRQQIESILNSNLDNIINSHPQIHDAFNENAWAELQSYGFYEYFKTVRDVNRYASSMTFHTNLFLGELEYEVNLVDLMALEVFRVFKPSLYRYLFTNRDILTGTWSKGYVDKEQRAEIERRLSSFHDEDKEIPNSTGKRNSIETPVLSTRDKAMVRFLFPDLVFKKMREQMNAGATPHTSEPRDEWYREKRLCHPDMFNRYFRMAVQDDDISHSDMQRFQQALFHEQDFASIRTEFEQADRFEIAMNRVRYYLDAQKNSVSQYGLFNLCRLADDMPIGHRSLLSLSLFQRTSAYMLWVLKEISPEIKGRGSYLLTAMQNSKAMAAVARTLLYERGKREQPAEFKGDQLLDDEGYEILKTKWLELVSDTSLEDPVKLLGIPAIATILWVWDAFSDGSGIRKWAGKLNYDAETRKTILKAFLVYSSEGDRIDTKAVNRFFSFFEANLFSGGWGKLDPENKRLHQLYKTSQNYYQQHHDEGSELSSVRSGTSDG